MKALLFSLLLITIAFSSAINFRLNTNEVTRLNIGESLISTLGFFKGTLTSANCSLTIYSFSTDTDSYTKTGSYSSPNVQSPTCRYLEVQEGKVVTDSNQTFMYVGDSFNQSTILTLDDNGIIRLIGTFIAMNRVDDISTELNISDFKKNQSFVTAQSQYQVNFVDQFPTIQNLRGWSYSASFGQLNINNNGNAGLGISYTYARFTMNNSNILDFNGRAFPAAIFPNITFAPRCFEPRLYLDFKPPYVFSADPYWPTFTLYEQGRYKVFTMTYSQLSKYDEPYKIRELNFNWEYSVCPEYTFEFKGNCVTVCPSPYYHEMRGSKGSCVLTCEEYTPRNESTRICSCMTDYEASKVSSNIITSCPANATSYPYGCFCNNPSQYFDRTFTFSCLQNCPVKTYPANGLCMNCPLNCDRCQKDGLYRSYFQCLVCSSGYQLEKGQCMLSCNLNYGLSSVGGSCTPCSDSNCLNCSVSADTCVVCSPLYTLSSGSCFLSCPDNNTLQVVAGFSSQCLTYDNFNCTATLTAHYKSQPFVKCDVCASGLYAHLNGCVKSCPAGYFGNSNFYCVCGGGLLTINNQCLSLIGCPIKMTYDSFSQSCLSCPFGCMSCQGSACTSCNPGYFLYISPQGIRCRRSSPLFPCDQQYGWIQGTCLVTNYTDPTLTMTTCLSNVINCKVCFPNRNDICILCLQGFYIYNNSCITGCPSGMIPYQNTCILTQIVNCLTPYLMLRTSPILITYSKIANSSAYLYFTFSGKQPANDPIGYIPYYQQLTKRKNDGQFRQSAFTDPTWTCLKCNDGYGLNQDFFTCLPCPLPCLTCYMAQNYSCLTLKPTNNTQNNNTNNNTTACQYYVDSQSRACIQSCSDSSKVPTITNGVLYCSPLGSSGVTDYARVDSAVYIKPDGTKEAFFIFEQDISSNNVSLSVQPKVSQVSISSVMRVSDAAPMSVNVQDNNYVVLKNQVSDAFILNLTSQLPNLVSDSGQSFPNTVYGVTSGQSHPQFMKTWLAIIGEIMSWVLIILHVMFIGNDTLYKVDNVIILAQTIYYFSFVKLLVGRLLAQFYYGWIYAHGGFFPNFFSKYIPNNYTEYAAPNSYKLATNDANVIRNAGFSFSLLLIFIGCYIGVTLVVWIISKLFKKPEMWYPKIAVNSLIAGIQFFSMNIVYWSIAHLLYRDGAKDIDADFYRSSGAVAIFFLCAYALYAVLRSFFNPLGGMYMIKRILLAAILAAAYQNPKFLAPLILLEAFFTFIRIIIESPEKTSERVYLFCEFLLYITCYLLMFLVLDSGVNSIIISIIIFVIIVLLAYDLSAVYLEFRNQWLLEEDDRKPDNHIVRAKSERRNVEAKMH